MMMMAVLCTMDLEHAEAALASSRVVISAASGLAPLLQAKGNEGLLEALQAALQQSEVLNSSECALVKHYGRRMVWDLGRPVVDLDADIMGIQLVLNATMPPAYQYVSTEVDLLMTGHALQLEGSILNNGMVVTSQAQEQQLMEEAARLMMPVASSGQSTFVEWYFKDSEPYSLQMEEVWAALAGANSTEKGRVNVAILDGGLADFLQNTNTVVYFEALEQGYDFISDPVLSLDGDGRDADPTDPGDAGPSCPVSSWHGTKMAACVCLRHEVVPGIHSMLPHNVIRLQPIRILGQCSTGYANDAADAIVWAAGGQINGLWVNPRPAKVISMSFSGYGQCPSFLQSAVDLAVSRGSTLVAAAGNQGGNAQDYFPANCRGVVSIASSTFDGGLSAYSNLGQPVMASAPGGDPLNPIFTVTVVSDTTSGSSSSSSSSSSGSSSSRISSSSSSSE